MSFIREVKVAGKEVTIRYSLPVQCELVTTRGTTVIPIVHYGGPFGTVPELLFEREQLIPALQKLLVKDHA